MPAKNLLRVSEKGTYSHICNKGVEERIIFNETQDYEVFLGYMKDYLTSPADPESKKKEFSVHGHIFRGTPHQPKNYFNKVELIGYSLMPTRFHLLLHQKARGSLQSFIRSLCTRYSMYFNKKYHHTGALFEGPYKSVQIKDIPRLLHLISYLYHSDKENKYSSYPEYLSQRETPWVKTKIVLSSFEKEGTNSYKHFVENYELGEKEKELLEGITLESKSQPDLEKRVFTQELTNSSTKIPMIERIPEFVAIVAVFFLLVGLGVRNINAQPAQVLGTFQAPSPSPSASESHKTKVVIKIDDGASRVNIRHNPTIHSEKIDEAKDGDIFELLSVKDEWYEVKLADGTTGFIATEYAYLEQTNN